MTRPFDEWWQRHGTGFADDAEMAECGWNAAMREAESREREARAREDFATRHLVRRMREHTEMNSYGAGRPTCKCKDCREAYAFLAGSGGEGT